MYLFLRIRFHQSLGVSNYRPALNATLEKHHSLDSSPFRTPLAHLLSQIQVSRVGNETTFVLSASVCVLFLCTKGCECVTMCVTPVYNLNTLTMRSSLYWRFLLIDAEVAVASESCFLRLNVCLDRSAAVCVSERVGRWSMGFIWIKPQ